MRVMHPASSCWTQTTATAFQRSGNIGTDNGPVRPVIAEKVMTIPDRLAGATAEHTASISVEVANVRLLGEAG